MKNQKNDQSNQMKTQLYHKLAKGSNILILTPSESGRFKFMILGSQMRVEWQKVPDVREISIIQREAREESLLAVEPSPEVRAWAESLLEKSEDGAELAAKLL